MSAIVSASAILISLGVEAIGERRVYRKRKDRKGGGAGIDGSDEFVPVHELIWRLSGSDAEESWNL